MRTPAPAVFGLSGEAYHALRKAGGMPHEAARRGGRPLDAVRWAMRVAFGQDFHEGLRLGVAAPGEQEILLARREAQLECWLERPLPVFDHGHPYGDRFKFHGRHRFGDREVTGRVERARRALAPSCWSPPPRWRGGAPRRARSARAFCRLG